MNARPRDLESPAGPPALAPAPPLPGGTPGWAVLDAAERATAVTAPLPPGACLYLRDEAAGLVAALHATAPPRPELRLWFAPAAGTLPAPAFARLVRRLDARARAAGAGTMRLQQKIPAGSPLACLLAAHGFEATEASIAHELDVATAGRVLDRLAFPAARLGGLARASLIPATMPAIRAVLEAEELMDGFELDTRCGRAGPGGIVLAESPALFDRERPVGFVLVARAGESSRRELAARWVDPSLPGRALVNLALMRDCLARARAAGITAARFRANPGRHADTMALARRIAAREIGRLAGFTRAVPPASPAACPAEEPA